MILNRHGHKIFNTSNLGVSLEQWSALHALYESLGDVYRFNDVPNMVKTNTVAEHTAQLMKLADFVAESLDDEQDRKDLRLLALIHDMGELCGEFTVVHSDLNGKSDITTRQKEIIEFEIFKTFYTIARYNPSCLQEALRVLRDVKDLQSLRLYAAELLTAYTIDSEEDLLLFRKFQGRAMNRMLPIYVKALDRAEGTIFYCNGAEDIDLTDKAFMKKAIEYNLVALYKSLPKNLGGRQDYINAFQKCQTILKAAVRRYKFLCRFDKLSFIDTFVAKIDDTIGRFYTWGKDDFVYFAKYWKMSDIFKIITGKIKVYKNIEEIYNYEK